MIPQKVQNQLIPNARCIALKSSAVIVGYASTGLVAISVWVGHAPAWIQALVNVPATQETLLWMAAGLSGPGVQIARVIKQNFFRNDSSCDDTEHA